MSGPQLLPKRPIFVNRVSEMADFLTWQREAANAGTPLLVAVVGAEGIGKTVFATGA